MQKAAIEIAAFLLPDLDSNQDTQIQKLMYYPYTIGQEAAKLIIKWLETKFSFTTLPDIKTANRQEREILFL